MAKFGDGHASGMARQGLKELRAALYTQANVAAPTEYGIYGTQTPGEVAAAREGNQDKDEEKQSQSILEARLHQTMDRSEEMDRDRTMEK